MTTQDILNIRLSNQHLFQNLDNNPAELVKYFGALQSQDYPGAKWALSQRLNFLPNEKIEQDFNKGMFLRTHVLRPTWHFVHSEDISWMLELTSQRVKAMMRSYNKALGLTEETFIKSQKIITNELKGRNYLTRSEIGELLKKNGVNWTGNGLAHIVMWTELDELICSGPIKRKQHTYALFSERVPKTKKLSREESLKQLVFKYFQSHGPAQIKDFVWWSGLTTADAKTGIEANSSLKSEIVDGKTYFSFNFDRDELNNKIHLLPNYDEYTVAYKDRSALFENVDHTKLDERQNALFNNAVVINGKVEGLWRRTLKTKSFNLEIRLFRKLTNLEKEELNKAIDKYAKFLNLEAVVSLN